MKKRLFDCLLFSLVVIIHHSIAGEVSAAQAPYPPSPVILKLTWEEEVMKVGQGAGDNWPITWVEENMQITSYGDGDGFDGQERNLSLGFARIWGDPGNIKAEDFASNIDTPEGGGSSGIKTSGLLYVDDTLYLFVRNYKPEGSNDFTNTRLAWSKDLGANWTWADWHISETFGCPEFVQFGKNYHYDGSQDPFDEDFESYVYIVSQDNDNAYEYSPNIVMARVPRNKIQDRTAYEFFIGGIQTGGTGPGYGSAWYKDINWRKPIFTDPQGTQRVSITYNPALQRYILVTSHRPAGSDATHTAALGVFDALSPWGPWTTVCYDDDWSQGCRTYHHKFPTKWMSMDGKSMWLLYSGLDCGLYTFCLKKANLKVQKTR